MLENLVGPTYPREKNPWGRDRERVVGKRAMPIISRQGRCLDQGGGEIFSGLSPLLFGGAFPNQNSWGFREEQSISFSQCLARLGPVLPTENLGDGAAVLGAQERLTYVLGSAPDTESQVSFANVVLGLTEGKWKRSRAARQVPS